MAKLVHTIYIRYRDDINPVNDWEETCLQFQGCIKLMGPIGRRLNCDLRIEEDCLYAQADKETIHKVLQEVNLKGILVRDINQSFSDLDQIQES